MADTKRDLGVGIVGCGNISGIYLRNMASFNGVKLIACADARPEAAEAAAKTAGIEALTVEALLARPDIDIVVNLTIPTAHYPISKAAFEAGKHVFSEKPLCVTVEEATELLALAKAKNLKWGCAPDTFLGGGARLARELIDTGKVGQILTGTCFLMSHGMEHWHPDPTFFFKPGGGPILDMGPYYLAALINLLGPIESVQARASAGFPERLVTAEGPKKGQSITVETPTTAMALLHFAGGADIVFVMSWDVWKHGHPPIELYGTEGSLRVPDPNFFGGIVETTERGGDWVTHDPETKPFGKPNWRSPNWAPTMPERANYRCLGIAELASAVVNGTPHRSSANLAAHALEVMHAILKAGTEGGTIAIKTPVERPVSLSDADASALWRG
jgi:predicted dehydrogenase